ncbi:hypothetical protein AEQ67_09465 [Pseudomonas sp. RIT-PI-q]|nr:hypothetical protein AEQ67_09465 [Pseudomonas sp. RIT-PI-q]
MTGQFNQFNSGKVGKALVTQKNIEWLHSTEHLMQGTFGTVSGGQLGEAVTLKQVLSRPELKGMIFHQQDA